MHWTDADLRDRKDSEIEGVRKRELHRERANLVKKTQTTIVSDRKTDAVECTMTCGVNSGVFKCCRKKRESQSYVQPCLMSRIAFQNN